MNFNTKVAISSYSEGTRNDLGEPSRILTARTTISDTTGSNDLTAKGWATIPNNTYLTAGDTLHVGTDDLCVSAWIKQTSNLGNNEMIFQKYGSGVGHSLYVDTSGLLVGYIQDTGGVVASTTGTDLRDGEWHHVAMVLDRSGNMTRYVDGEVYGDTDDISAKTSTITNDSSFNIGTNSTAVVSFFAGLISDVRIYIATGDVWSPGDISNQYNNAYDITTGGSLTSSYTLPNGIFNALSTPARLYNRTPQLMMDFPAYVVATSLTGQAGIVLKILFVGRNVTVNTFDIITDSDGNTYVVAETAKFPSHIAVLLQQET